MKVQRRRFAPKEQLTRKVFNFAIKSDDGARFEAVWLWSAERQWDSSVGTFFSGENTFAMDENVSLGDLF